SSLLRLSSGISAGETQNSPRYGEDRLHGNHGKHRKSAQTDRIADAVPLEALTGDPMARPDPKQLTFDDAEMLIAPKRAAQLLDVSRSEIDRIATRAGWARTYLSEAKRGSVRYRLSDVMKFIQNRTVTKID